MPPELQARFLSRFIIFQLTSNQEQASRAPSSISIKFDHFLISLKSHQIEGVLMKQNLVISLDQEQKSMKFNPEIVLEASPPPPPPPFAKDRNFQ